MHLPLAADIGIEEEAAAQFAIAERRALGAASLVIVTGRATLPLIAAYAAPGKSGRRRTGHRTGTDRTRVWNVEG